MAEDMESENRNVVAFLNHLACNKSEGEDFEDALLTTIVKFAEAKGYHFGTRDIKKAVTAKFCYGAMLRRWPWPR